MEAAAPVEPGESGVSWMLTWHQHKGLHVAGDELVLSPQQVPVFEQIQDLLVHLSDLLEREGERIAQATMKAQEAGFQAGLIQGSTQAQMQGAQSLADTLQNLRDAARVESQALQESVVTLSVLMLKRMVCELAPEDVLLAMLRRLVSQQIPMEAMVIHLHPDLLDSVRERWVAGTGGTSCEEGVDWRADEDLGLLDCVVESAAGRLLAGLPTQIDRIDTLLRTTMVARPAAPMSLAAGKPTCRELA